MADVPTIHGECDTRFAKVRDGFASNFAAGKEIGASVCVTVDGKPVVDLWAGHADKARTPPWHKNTIVNVYSIDQGTRRRVREPAWSNAACSTSMRRSRSTGPSSRRPAKRRCRFATACRIRRGCLRCGRRSTRRGHVRLEQDVRGTRRAGTVVDAGHRARLSRDHLRLARRRTRAARVSGRSIGRFFREEIVHPLALDAFIGCGPELDARIAEWCRRRRPPAGTRDLLAEMMADKESIAR